MDERVTELLLAGREEWLFSDCPTESLEALVVEADLTDAVLLGPAAADLGSLASEEETRGVPGGVRSQS